MSSSNRLPGQSGIAIGMLLFILALLAVTAVAFTATGNFNGAMINADRIMRDLRSQGDLIRNQIKACYMNFNAIDHSGAGYFNTANYPASTGTGTLVEALTCPTYGAGNQNLWTGQGATLLPLPTKGFGKWVYVNAGDANGRCIRTQPDPDYVSDSMYREGLAEAASGFSDQERIYDGASASQRFIIWITKPTGTPSADCSS